MSTHSQITIVSLAKIAFHHRINEMRSARTIAKYDSPPTNPEPELIEDSPPSYYSTVSQDVDETSTKESIISDFNIVTSQPRTSSPDSFELSTRSSIQSTKLSMDTRLLSSKAPVKRTMNNAWNEKIVIRNIYQRDQISLLCFCATTLGGIASLALYCTT